MAGRRVIRREFGQLPRLFRSAAKDRARSKVIGAHAREMLDFLHTHHTGEDELLFPLLRERAALDPELMDRMDVQHAQVNHAVAAIGRELPAWTAHADAAAGERMAALIDATMPSCPCAGGRRGPVLTVAAPRPGVRRPRARYPAQPGGAG